MRNRRWIIDVVIPLGTFIAGIIAPIIVDRITKSVTSEQQITLLILLSFALAFIVLAIVNSEFFQEVQKGQYKLGEQLERLGREYGLKVEFVEDTEKNPGLSYERTTELILNAQSSLVFVDCWIQTADYLLQATRSSYDRRQAYYAAIIEQIRKHQDQTGPTPFHRRIVQMSSPGDINQVVLVTGDTFKNYVRECCKIQGHATRASVIKISQPYIQAQFIIVDQRFVILPLLTSVAATKDLKRHGAIIIEDPNPNPEKRKFVLQMMTIYNLIDNQAQPITPHHLGLQNF